MTVKKQVLLGMSGGTDSSVAAMIFQWNNYEVTGVTFRFYEPEGRTDYLDEAAQLAEKLNIKHLIYDVRDAFKEQVIGYFTTEYLAGHTPFPCVYCNQVFKWPLLAKIADELDIPYISTGHYARIVVKNEKFYISPGVDPDKDQSFFLWGLPQTILQRAILPLGSLLKEEVREIAEKKGFRQIAQKRDSMSICFSPGDYRIFLGNQPECRTIRPGAFIDTEGRIIGQHQGYPFYTIGQRRGLIHLNRPIYVKEIDPEHNRVTLAPLQELYKTRLWLKNVRIVHPDDFSDNATIICRIRYRKQQSRCLVSFPEANRAIVCLEQPEHSVAPGQTAVFYSEGRVLGGGIIEKAE